MSTSDLGFLFPCNLKPLEPPHSILTLPRAEYPPTPVIPPISVVLEPPAAPLSFRKMTLQQLRDECRKYGLVLTGNKAELVSRLEKRIAAAATEPEPETDPSI